MVAEDLKQRVASIRWYHTIDLGNGLVTEGIDNTPKRLRMLGLPETLEGRTVLDIGAWDGFFSFEAERRGASRVLATDHYCWVGPGWANKNGFLTAREALGSRVEDRELDVIELAPESCGVFDVVFFFGVLYHLEDPMRALRRVFSVTGGQLILETACDWIGTRDARAAFYPGCELGNDPTNWWGPNPAAVVGMLRTVGFSRVEVHFVQPFHERLGLAALKRMRGTGQFFPTLRQGRAVFHAWR